MDNRQLADAAKTLGTAQIVDACVRLNVNFVVAPPGLTAVNKDDRIAGRVVPVRHFGSADVLFQAVEQAEPGDIIVVDNGGREDEACIGDLIVMEAQHADVAGLLIWGRYRDARVIARLGFPLFSYGTCVVGPRRLRRRTADPLKDARMGHQRITRGHVAFADVDGAVFVRRTRIDAVVKAAREILEVEEKQARLLRSGRSLRAQFRFNEYLERRARRPSYSFGRHLDSLKSALGEPITKPRKKRSSDDSSKS